MVKMGSFIEIPKIPLTIPIIDSVWKQSAQDWSGFDMGAQGTGLQDGIWIWGLRDWLDKGTIWQCREHEKQV